jgi:dynactin 2
LNSRLSLIEPSSLDALESRLQIVLQRLNQIGEKKSLVEDSERLARINEMYSLLSKWKDFSSLVPAVVERLNSLNELHEKALEFSKTLTRLDNEQQQMKQELDTGTVALNEVKY